jgi:hypothetical protein
MTDKTWIQTFHGSKKFYPLEPERNEFHVEDVARSLSMLCRYNGHVSRFYSVAEHSVWVFRLVLGAGGTEQEQKWALIHDASEAYLADVPRPVKHMPEMQPYRDAEKRLQNWIATSLGLPAEEPAIVKHWDCEILGTEARLLKSPIHPDWAASTPSGQLPRFMNRIWLGLDPAAAERTFLYVFRKLWWDR